MSGFKCNMCGSKNTRIQERVDDPTHTKEVVCHCGYKDFLTRYKINERKTTELL